MSNPNQKKPAPLETDAGQQKDDNIDDLGRRPDGTEQDQPTHPDADDALNKGKSER
jgi:hypothetical protein